jgi:Holliday junction DNA helicase RuvA
MIGSLRGEVIEKGEGFILLDVGGVGYIVQVAAPLLDEAQIGMKLFLRIYHHVRENAVSLFGFNDTESQEIFEEMLKVQGIGPKVALAIQSHLSNETLKHAVAQGDAAVLSRVPGIGPKKAKQIAFQLKGKITADDIFTETVPMGEHDGEVLSALTGLGYSIVEAQTALQNLPKSAKTESIEEKIRLALSGLARL